MLMLTAVIVGLVFRYRVHGTVISHPTLSIPGTESEAGIYYVNLSSTILVFVASWSSSLAPLLGGLAMYLVAYPVASHFREAALRDRPENMPTPKQLAMMIQFLDGSAGSALWSWWSYLRRWRHKRSAHSPVLALPAFVTVLMFLLSLLVFLADTWLHITTSAVNLVQTSDLDPLPHYGLSLRHPACTATNGSVAAECGNENTCSVSCPAYGAYFDFTDVSTQVVNNISDTMAVYSNAPDPLFAYIGIAPSARSSYVDFTAISFGARTQCQPISKECNLYASSAGTTQFWCSDAFSEYLGDSSLYIQHFTNSSLQNNYTRQGVSNPFYYGIAAGTPQNSNSEALVNSSLEEDQAAAGWTHGGLAYVLLCQTTVFDIEYDSVNNTITRFQSIQSNDSVANLWQSVVSDQVLGLDVESYLSPIISLATLESNTMQELADKVAVAYNKVISGVAAYSLNTTTSLAAQQRTTILVTRLPQAPFFSLVVTNLLFVILGIVLTTMTWKIMSSATAIEVHQIVSRLGITSLVTNRFENEQATQPLYDIEEAFEEFKGHGSKRIGVSMTKEGGYSYHTWLPLTSTELTQILPLQAHSEEALESSE